MALPRDHSLADPQRMPCDQPPPNYAVQIFEALNILEGYPIGSPGWEHNSVNHLHHFIVSLSAFLSAAVLAITLQVSVLACHNNHRIGACRRRRRLRRRIVPCPSARLRTRRPSSSSPKTLRRHGARPSATARRHAPQTAHGSCRRGRGRGRRGWSQWILWRGSKIKGARRTSMSLMRWATRSAALSKAFRPSRSERC